MRPVVFAAIAWLCTLSATVFPTPTVTDTNASLCVMRPPLLLGGKKATLTVDDKPARRRTGTATLTLSLTPGLYEAYAISTTKPRLSLRMKPGEKLYVLKHGDQESEKLIKHNPPTQSATRASSLPEPSRATRAVISLLRPEPVLGSRGAQVTIDGRSRRAKRTSTIAAFEAIPGQYHFHAGKPPKSRATITIQPGELLYVIDADDPAAQRALGDIMYLNRARAAALGRYRRSLQLDSTQKDLYRRFAELAVQSGGRKEAIAALTRLIAGGLADGATYQSLGDLLMKEKRVTEAQAMYDTAITRAGTDAVVLASLGAAKRSSGDQRGAIFAYRKAVEYAPGVLANYEILGELYLKQTDTAAAVALYGKYIDEGGTLPIAFRTIATFHMRQHRYEDALRFLRQVKGAPAQQAGHLAMLGEAYYWLAEYREAIEPLREAATTYPKDKRWPATTELLIKCYMAIDAHDKAQYWVTRYSKVVKRASADIAFYRAFLAEKSSAATARAQYENNAKLYPRDYRNHLRLGLLAARTPATLPQAATLLRKSIELADTISEAWLAIAGVYRQLEKPEDEAAALRVFCAAQPQHPQANARLGELMLSRGQTGEALERLENAQRSGSDDPGMLIALARGYARTGRTTEAIQALEQARQRSPADIEIHTRLIELYQSAGDTTKVIEGLKHLLEIKRDNSTLLTYARCLYAAGSLPEAADAIENIRATDPQNIPALMLLARILRAQQNYETAVDVYKEVSYIDATNPDALFERAETHVENSQPHWAELFYTRALKEQPRNARAVLGLAKVAKLRRQQPLYLQHLRKAYSMAPEDSAVSAEYELSTIEQR